MEAHSGISEKTIHTIAGNLATLLADIHQLYIKTLAYHWNVEDARFSQLHEFFETLYQQLAQTMDEVAERIRKLGQFAPSTLSKLTSLKRLGDTQDAQTGNQMISFLAEDFERLCVWLREDIKNADELGDPGTSDMLVGILRDSEKAAWMLRSHLST